MVTNRHVLEGKDSVVIRLKERQTGTLHVIDVPIRKDGTPLYSAHPDKNADIAVVLLVGGFFESNNLLLSAFDIDNHALTSSEFIQKGGDEGSYIYMLGYPMGLVNIDSTVPICRSGCVARIDEKEIATSKEMLLDIQNFPGNSGSPIISKPELVGIEGTPVLNQSALIGIVSGYLPYEEHLMNTQTKKVVEIRSENSGIAVANPVEFIRDVMDMEFNRIRNTIANP